MNSILRTTNITTYVSSGMDYAPILLFLLVCLDIYTYIHYSNIYLQYNTHTLLLHHNHNKYLYIILNTYLISPLFGCFLPFYPNKGVVVVNAHFTHFRFFSCL
jgi:hypothetical protein